MRTIHAIIGVLMAIAVTVSIADSIDETLRYDAYWMGMRVGEMKLESGRRDDGAIYRSMLVGGRSLARMFSGSDTTAVSETIDTPQGKCQKFHKRVDDSGFKQDDTMYLWPESGIAVWESASGTSVTSSVPVGSVDVATFFHGLRESAELDGLQTNLAARTVVMDGTSHRISISTGEVVRVDLPSGAVDAREYFVESHSSTLFVRNVPKCARIATNFPVMVEMDVKKGAKTIHFRLKEWTTNSVSALPR